MTDVLNLGCGNQLIDGAVNHDRTLHRSGIDVAHDLNELPWPWADESFNMIVALAVLEHLKLTLIESVSECWRILRPDGIVYLKLPHWQHEHSYVDPTHYWAFSLRTCDVFDPATRYGKQYGFYCDRKWTIIEPATLNRGKSSFYLKMRVMK